MSNDITEITEESTTENFPAVVNSEPHGVTPAQAKIDAVANLTMKVYERASQLNLTEDEMRRLQAEFPDSAFRSGAGGKDNLIYIEHAYLRDRMNEVFGPGQWSIIPRSRWSEDFVTGKGKKGVRIYVEAMLCVRGCFVGEAIGDMDYYKNDSTNYGDAVEGAKTAALRRCVKELGVGLQAWKKEWCEGWWARRNNPKPAAKPTETADPAIVATWKERLNPDTMNLDKLNLSMPEVKKIGHDYTRRIVWGMALKFADENNCVFDETKKLFVSKVIDPVPQDDIPFGQ